MQLSPEERADMAKQRTTGKVPPEMEHHPPKASSRKTMCELEGPYNLWASLVAQLEKYMPAMRETWVQSLGWEDPLGEGKGYSL